jgi:hypothetical protein
MVPCPAVIFLVLYSQMLHRDTSVLANNTAGLQFCYHFNISTQWRIPEHLSHFPGVQSSFKRKNHSQPCVWLKGSHIAALFISFDSHFICFYVKVDTHVFHSLGHHKYDICHKHYSLLVMTAARSSWQRTCRNTSKHALKKSCCSVIWRYNKNELRMDTFYQAMYFNNFLFFHRYHVWFTFQAATSWQQ